MVNAHSAWGKRRDVKGQVLERTWTDEAVGGGARTGASRLVENQVK